MSPPDSATPITQTHSIEDEIESSSSEAIEALEKSMATNNTDPVHSSRFSLSQSSSTNSLSGEHNFVPIEPDLYKFLVNGTKDEILGLSTNLEDFKSLEERNSVLHIAASAGQSDLISDILPQCKELIKWKNIKGDLPLHSAAKSGQLNALKALITWDGFSKEILEWVNKEGDTVLHIALQNNQQEMGEFLVGENCIGKACYMMNNEEVCPLYLGIKLGYWDLVRNIISYTSQNKEDSEKALLQGMSVVHAAIEVNNIEILKELLNNHRNLIESWDEEGRSPLSYAAFKGYLEVVQYLHKEFPECAFKCDKDVEGSFPIHRAASGGSIKVIKELHHTKSLLNRTEQNILHVAAASGKSKLVSYLLKVQELHGLINRKDEDGNTPLHLATKGFHPRGAYILTREKRCKCELQNKDGLTALDVAEYHSGPFPTFDARLTWMALRYVDAPRSSQSTRKRYAQNNGIQKQYSKGNDTNELEGYKDRVNTPLLVATLVATVTFTAGFTLPGGYNQSNPDIGMAVLAHFWAFKVFVLCNTAALYSAILSVVTLIWAHMRDLKLILVSLKFAMLLLGFALAMMFLAFMMGIFVVLKTVSWLSYVVLGMGFVFLLTVLVILIPLYNPSYIRNSLVRFFFSGTFLLLLIVRENSITEFD